MKKRRAITLIEILIVIALIAVIGSALAVNMGGSLSKGKAFKTEQHIARIQEILMLEKETGDLEASAIVSKWEEIVKKCPIVKGSEVVHDGWGGSFAVTYNENEDRFEVKSQKLVAYNAKHKVAK